MHKTKNNETLVTVSEKGLLALVAYRLKDAVLFPEKLECAKKYLDKVKVKST